jgi:hypothetical protein
MTASDGRAPRSAVLSSAVLSSAVLSSAMSRSFVAIPDDTALHRSGGRVARQYSLDTCSCTPERLRS